MTDYKENTAETYDDMVGYISEDNLPKDLGQFIGLESEYTPTVKEKNLDPDFAEEWQNLYVNFRDEEGYIEFMRLIGEIPSPKVRPIIYNPGDSKGILAFLGD